MNLIPSFQVDHTKIVPGIYESRVDTIGDMLATTFGIRMKTPNKEPAIHPNAMHTIEHVIATYLRNNVEWSERIIYWGPMGCLTGLMCIRERLPCFTGKQTSRTIHKEGHPRSRGCTRDSRPRHSEL